MINRDLERGLIMERGYTKEGLAGTKIHCDKYGNTIGFSKPAAGGQMVNYDVNGNFIGCTKTDLAGVKHSFDADGDYDGDYLRIGDKLIEFDEE